MAADDTYAPKSPDLSSLYSAGPTPPAPQLSHSGFHSKNYRHPEYKSEPELQAPDYPFSPSSSSYNPPPLGDLNHVAHPYSQHQQHQHQQVPVTQFDQPRTFKSETFSTYSPSVQHHYLPPGPVQSLPPTSDYGHQPPLYQQQPPPSPYGQPYPDQDQYNNAPHYSDPYARPQGASVASTTSDPPPTDMPPRRAPPPPAPEIEPSPVRTKFPTARIKRIMQADEEVGKVAQQTPIAVGKALEMFMIQLVTKSAEVAQEKGSKRVTAPMLKQVVETDEQWDFLRDIVSRVENEKEGKAKAKAESSSDEEIPEPKKRTRGGGRKKKAA